MMAHPAPPVKRKEDGGGGGAPGGLPPALPRRTTVLEIGAGAGVGYSYPDCTTTEATCRRARPSTRSSNPSGGHRSVSKAMLHARSWARRWGGKADDYLAIHERMDSTK